MKKPYYIDYPQAHVEGQAHTYQCAFCKLVTTKINGNLDGHLATCEYRLNLENAGFEKGESTMSRDASDSDETD